MSKEKSRLGTNPEGRRVDDYLHELNARRGREKSEAAAVVGASRPPHAARKDMLESAYRQILNGAALRLAGFHPSQWTTIVCGRPVQVAPK